MTVPQQSPPVPTTATHHSPTAVEPATARAATVLLVAGLLAGGCAETGTSEAPANPGGAASAGATGVPSVAADGSIRGVFQAWTAGATAVTYDPTAVPAGATARVVLMPAADGVTVTLSMTGLTPRRGYGAHLHTAPCTATPAEAGSHYQHRPDPKAATSPPSVDPAYANPRNEVWLDVTTDPLGQASATASQTWPFDAAGPPRSLVVHAQRTETAAGTAGTAGARVACLTLPA